MNEIDAGLLLFVTPILMMFISPYAGKLSDRKDPRLISGVAMILITISLAAFIFLDGLPLYIIVISLIIQGIGHGLFSSPNNKYVLTLVSIDDLPDASALLSSIKDIGRMLSLAIMNILCAIHIGHGSLSLEIKGLILSSKLMMTITFLVAASSAILLFLSKYIFDKS